MDGITVAQLTTVGGIAIVTTLLNQLIWSTSGASPATKDRFGPIVAVITGVALGVVAGFVLAQTAADIAQSALNGLLGGFASIGLYDVATSKAGLSE